MSRIAIIGSGFAGLSAAAYLSDAGQEVEVFEKNAVAGGRARQLSTAQGYTFDMGPSWYWMPKVYDDFFADFGHTTQDFYQLTQLSPSFEVIFEKGQAIQVPADFEQLQQLFESIEKGAAANLRRFMEEAKYKYEQGMEKLVYMPGLSWREFVDIDLIKGAMRLQVFSSFSSHVRRYFAHPWLIALMEFPVLFLGAMPQKTPALYSLMNYAGLLLGTWYPAGGFGGVIAAMTSLVDRRGGRIHCNANVDQILTADNRVTGLLVNGREQHFDAVVAAADYHHVEADLLPERYRNYDEDYWDNRTFAPSSLIFYIGLNKKIDNLHHHTLFFEEELYRHSVEIYEEPQWPSKPLFYACCPSKTDNTVAPEGHENLFLLMPLAPGLEDTEILRERYYHEMMQRLENRCGQPLRSYVDYKKGYCVSDFITDYNAYKGNAYGLANTLRQTAILKPSLRNKKLKNLVYAGQLTVPGPGVPPSLISGKLAAQQILQQLKVPA